MDDIGSPDRRQNSPFDTLTPLSRFDESDLEELAPLVHPSINGHSLRPSASTITNSKLRRRCSELTVSPTRRASMNPSSTALNSFSTSHWLSALFEWIYVTFSEKKHQEYVLKEIIQCLNKLGVIPFNVSITSEQLLEVQGVIDSLRMRVWKEHGGAKELSNGLTENLLPFPNAVSHPSAQLKHSVTFAGASLAKFANFAAEKPSHFKSLPPLPLAVLFPPGRLKNDFTEHEQLGHGGFGVVVKAVNRFDGTSYAIKKVFVKRKMINHDFLLRSLREVRAASSLNHPNIVRYYSAWVETIPDEEAQVFSSNFNSDDSYKTSANFSDSNSRNRQVTFSTSSSSSSCASEGFNVSRQLDKEFRNFGQMKPAIVRKQIGRDDSVRFGDSGRSSGEVRFNIQEDEDDNDSDDEDDVSIIFGSQSSEQAKLDVARAAHVVPARRRAESEHVPVIIGNELVPAPEEPNMVCLIIQMELCALGNLADFLSRRNSRISASSLSPSTPPTSPSRSPDHTFTVGSLPVTTEDYRISLVNASWNAAVFLQIVRGLAFVHSRGVIHRDLKPANIFLTGPSLSCPEVKLGDFGLTRFDVFSQGGDNTSLAKADLIRYSEQRRYSTNVGTQTYSSPEQATRLVYTRQSDMFSLGLILYELYRPFATIMERQCHFDALRNGSIDDLDVSSRYPGTWQLIKRLTDPNPIKRPNCSDLLAELETNEVDRLREVVEQQRREIERLRQVITADVSTPTSRYSTHSSS